MTRKKASVVTLRTKGNKRLSDEPEMKEIKRMIRDGELSSARIKEHLKDRTEDDEDGRR